MSFTPSPEPSSPKDMVIRLGIFSVICMAAVAIFAPAPPRVTATAPQTPTTPPSCDLGEGPCLKQFDASHSIELDLTPRPIRVVMPLRLRARFGGQAKSPIVTFTSTTMDMGRPRVPLRQEADGSWVAPTALPICSTNTMHWLATIDVDLDGEAHQAVFSFTTERSTTAPSASDDNAAAVAAVQGAAEAAAGAAAEAVDPVVVVDAELVTKGGPLRLSSLRGQLLLVSFGYASCPDVCPMGLSALAAGLKKLTPDERAKVQGVFISVDPARDTLEALEAYGAFFDERIVGATGSAEQVKAAAATFGAVYSVVTEGENAGVIDHSAFVAVVDADGRYVARLPHAAPPSLITQTIRAHLGSTP
jgi:protein SCO1/2